MAADHDKSVEMEMDEKLSSRVSSIGSYPVNFSTSHHVVPSNLDLLSVDFSNVGRASSFGFMELLGIPALGPSLFDFSSKQAVPVQLDQHKVFLEKTTSDTTAGNPPATPNTSSISISSTEARTDEQQPKRARDENNQVMDEKVSKPKNKKQKKEREPRFAFVTKSEVDHLEDGYRW